MDRWHDGKLLTELRDLNTIKLLLLDRKLHSKTTFFKRRKTGETGDLALLGILWGEKPLKQRGFCLVLLIFPQVLLYALKFSMQFVLAVIQSNIF